MTVLTSDRPAEVKGRAGGGAPARRAVVRWGWRLFRREWRRHLLIISMLALAVAATIVGLGTATNAAKLSADPEFGTAATILSLRGSGPQLSDDLEAIRARVGAIDVVAHQEVAVPGSVSTIDLRDQRPGGTFNGVTLRLDSGRYPTGPGEVALSEGASKLLNIKVGGMWTANGQAWHVVGTVENPLNLQERFALVAPGHVVPAATVSVFTDWHPVPGDGLQLPSRAALHIISRGHPSTAAVDALVLALGTLGLLFVGLMAVAGFTVMAQRRHRALGMLAAVGATDRHVRLVLLADGAVVGGVGALAGAVVGLAAWFAFVPALSSLAGHRIDRSALPWWAVGAMLLLATLTAVGAAWWPARAIARTSVVAALSGRPSPPQPAHRFAAAGTLLLAGGLVLLFLSRPGSEHPRAPMIVTGTLAIPVGLLFLAPLSIRLLAAAGRHTGVAVRLALRDLVRYQARSGAALGSVTLAVGIAAAIAVSAAASDAPQPVGNLPTDQLMVHLSPNREAEQAPPLSGDQLQAVTTGLQQIASDIGARSVVPLEQAYSPQAGLQPAHAGPRGRTVPAGYATTSLSRITVSGPGIDISTMNPLYVATPSLLAHYGIPASAVDPTADVLSARTDLQGLKIFTPELRGGQASSEPGTASNAPRAPKISSVEPRIQTLSQLPLYTSAPSILLTTGAVQRLGLGTVPAAWLIQAAGPLTDTQIQTATTAASALGLYVENRDEQASLAPLRNWSTAVGVLVALGVLGMTVGLIRSETAGDLRTLAAAGASSTIRRTIAGATSAALALLGAILGTAGAYAALLVWHRSDLSPLHRVPVVNLAVILAGLPLLAWTGGWLLAGREPPALGRPPLE